MLYLAVALSAALGGFVQSVTGFGAAVVMMTFLPHFFNMAVAPSLSSSICLGLTVTLALRFRKYVKLRILLLPMLLYMVTSVTAINLLGEMDLHLLTIAFGVLLMFLGAYLSFASKAVLRPTSLLAVICGLLGGTCGGLFSIGGPFMSLYFLPATESREEYIGNLQTSFAINCIIGMVARTVNGFYTLSLVPLTILGIAGVLIGQHFGLKFWKRLNAVQLRRLVYAYISLSGVVTIVQQLV